MTTSGLVKTSLISVLVLAHKGGISSNTSSLGKAPCNYANEYSEYNDHNRGQLRRNTSATFQ